MNPEIKAAWVAALRSGEYEQGRGALRVYDKFCCLGVLCNLHAQAHPEFAATQKHPSVYASSTCFLPGVVMHWAELNGNPMINGSTLSHLNDRGDSFDKIADEIERHL